MEAFASCMTVQRVPDVIPIRAAALRRRVRGLECSDGSASGVPDLAATVGYAAHSGRTSVCDPSCVAGPLTPRAHVGHERPLANDSLPGARFRRR